MVFYFAYCNGEAFYVKKVCSILLVLFLLSACGQEETYEPQAINPEVDVCEVCNMSLSDNFYATQIISKENVSYKFDDIGCMIEYVEKDQRIAKEDIAKQYVRDMVTSEWIEIENAYFVYHADFWTPMSNGVISFASKEEAENYLTEQGKGELYDYSQLQEHKWSWES